jgi:hypothetical protein
VAGGNQVHVLVDDPTDPRAEEVSLDFPREWVEFADPDNERHLIRADLTWLLSRWTCVFGRGCHGILPDRAAEGCCSHGAFFTDGDDEKRVRQAARRLTPKTWQHHRRGFKNYTEMDTVDGKTPARRTATRPDGPCVFLNDPDFPGGGGCALHGQALRDGVHPLEYKPDVCWQLPVRRDQEWTKRVDNSKVLLTVLTEFDRRGWGEGGHDLHWWCTSAPSAHVSGRLLYQEYEPELVALIGKGAYGRLAELCAARAAQGLVAPHPATVVAGPRIPVHRAEPDGASEPAHPTARRAAKTAGGRRSGGERSGQPKSGTGTKSATGTRTRGGTGVAAGPDDPGAASRGRGRHRTAGADGRQGSNL